MIDGTFRPTSMLCIGVGNDFRRDDAVGLVVARGLRGMALPNLTVIEASGEGAALMQAWAGYEKVYLVDATSSGVAAGTVHHFAAHEEMLPSQFFSYSTHAFSVAEAIELARVLDLLPPVLHVFGIEGSDFSTGHGLSDKVTASAMLVLNAIKNIVASIA